MSDAVASRPLPDIGAVLMPLLARVAPAEQPLLIAIAERMAAERYRRWATEVGEPAAAAGLRACAVREDDIATRVEALFPDAAAIEARIRAALPDLATITDRIFGGRPLAEQFAIQASGERLGAGTWRTFAAAWPNDADKQAFLACAPLEEASADFLESLR